MALLDTILVAAGFHAVGFVNRGDRVGSRLQVVGRVSDRHMAGDAVGGIFYVIFDQGPVKGVLESGDRLEPMSGHFLLIFMAAGA